MQLYRDDAVVLRTQKLGEADRIITLLARTTGRVRAVAKGVRRTKSRFGARLEPFTHVDLMLHPGRSLDVITQAEVIRPYGAPLPRTTPGTRPAWPCWRRPSGSPRRRRSRRCASSCCSSAACGPSGRGSMFRPGARRLPAPVARGGRLRAGPGGVRPLRRAGPRRRLPAFAIPSGGMVCASCRPPGRPRPPRPTVTLMPALLRGDWDSADRSERRHQVECSGLVAAYLQWHLEHSIRSLRHVERV